MDSTTIACSRLCPSRGQAILGVAQEGLPESAPSVLRSDREPVDGAAPSVPPSDDGTHDAPVRDSDDERTRVAAQQAAECLRRVGGCRLGGVPPERQDVRNVVSRRRPERDLHGTIVGTGPG